MKKVIVLSAMMLTALVAMAKDIKTVVVTTLPQMHCESCENKIKKNLRFEKGVVKIETSVEAQTVTVTYNPAKTNVENIQAAMKKIGYDTKIVSDHPKEEKQKKKAK